jgi:hypothetical protein
MRRLYGTRDPGLPGDTSRLPLFSACRLSHCLEPSLGPSASLESNEQFNFEDSGRLRHRVQLHSAGPMLLMLNVHPSRRSDLLSDDKLEFSPKGQARNFKDAFGNICSRLVAESPVALPPVSLESRHAVSHALNPRPRMLRASTGQHAGLNMSLLRRHHAAPPDDPKTWSAFGTVHVRLPFLRTGRNKGS